MKVIYVADHKTGELMYWLENIDGRVIREYPDGHTEKADEEETALMQ